MFDPNGNGVMDPQEEYLAFRIWEEMCGINEEDPGDPEDPDLPSSPG